MNPWPLDSRRLYPALRPRIGDLWIHALIVLAALTSVAKAEFSEKVVELAKRASVRVFSQVGDGMSSGTGFVVGSGSHVVTNYHVVKGGGKVAVIYGRGESVFIKEAAVVVSDPGRDLVILKCVSLPQTESFLLANRETKGGQEVMAVGFPGILDDMYASRDASGLQPTGRPDEFVINAQDIGEFDPVTFPGNVGKEMRINSGFGGTFRAIAHSAKISEGNSGGALIDKDGRVVGINVQGAANRMGADYSFAIHVSELVALAGLHSIPIETTSSKVSSGGGKLQVVLWIAVAAFAVVVFLLLLRKPRIAMAGTLSRLVHSKRQAPGEYDHRTPSSGSMPAPVPAVSNNGGLRLRGRDLQGRSYDLSFHQGDFRRNGGRLVIGRSHDLSQLLVSHDSVSRQHVTLTLSGSTVLVDDRNSGNGTRINGHELAVGAPSVPLRPGDRLTLGEVDLIFEVIH